MITAIQSLGKFDGLQEIREGANGYAFSARHRTLGRKCFLKAIYLPPGDDAQLALNEAEALISVMSDAPPCDNIARLYDAEIVHAKGDQQVLLQMEWIDGQSLRQRIAEAPFGQQDTIRVVSGVLRGLCYLHAKRMVHRDIKPGNIMLTSGPTPIAKVTDFGSVAQMPVGKVTVNASKHSDLYRPPEASAENPTCDFRSDVYQAGLLLHEVACGPFPDSPTDYIVPKKLRELKTKGRDYDTLDAHEKCLFERSCLAHLSQSEGLIKKTGVLQPYLSPQLRRLINKATRADPVARFDSATDFLNCLSRVSVPNWKPDGDSFKANAWKGWDWQSVSQSNRRRSFVEILRARSGTGNFRRFEEHANLATAFAAVENLRD